MTAGGNRKPRYGFGDIVMPQSLPWPGRTCQPDSAIESVKHLVLIVSRRALSSDWINREWSHARIVGKRVCPVLADPSITRADLPRWMSREEVFVIDRATDRDEERWKALVLVRASIAICWDLV